MSGPMDIVGRIVYTDEGATATLDKVSKSADGQAAATAKAGDAAKAAGPQMGVFGASVGLAGQAVSKLSPALGQMTTMAGSSLGAIQSLTTAGMGPLGLAVAGISLAVTAGTAAWGAYTLANKEAEDAARALSESLEQNEYSLTTIMGEQAKHRADIQTRIRIASADATTDELLAERQRLNNSLALMRGTALEGSASMTEILRQRLDLEDRLTLSAVQARADAVYAIESKAARNTADAWREAARRQAADKESGTGAYARPRGGGGPSSAEQTQAAVAEAIDPLIAVMETNRAIREADAADQLATERDLQAKLALLKEDARIADQERIDQAIDDEERRVTAIRRQIDREAAARAKAAKIEDDILRTTASAHTMLASIIEASAGTSEKAQKAKTQALAAASMISSGVEMAVEIARIAQSYPDPVGMATHAIGAANFAVAIGVAAAAAGGGGAPSGGGGGAPAASAPGGGPSGSPPQSERGGNNYTINIGGSAGVVYADDRNGLMRTIADGVRAADARRGR